MQLTEAQETALERLWERDKATVASNLKYEKEHNTFLPKGHTKPSWESREVMRESLMDCGDYVLIQWRGMWLGIEKDGYTHS